MSRPSIVAAFALLSLAALPLGCTTTVVAPAHHAPRRGAHVPFRGMYTKVAEGTFKNGRRVRMANANGAATIRIEGGRVTYDQTYITRGEMKRVVQIYSFGPGDVRRAGGDYEVLLTFRGMTGDTASYSPDRNDPRLEARRIGGGWEISLLTTDNNNVVGIVEFQ